MNLLADPLISVDVRSGERRRVSLPELFVLSSADEVRAFPRLRPHQAPAWHVLLVQLATLALRQVGQARIDDADGWAAALRALVPGTADDAAWRLVVDDWMQPAFLQSPMLREAERADYKREFTSADALDVLVTSKNHDVKAARMVDAEAEEWLFALTTLQTSEGFLGAGNYGIARMNGGFASRPMLRCAPAGLGPGGQIFRDVAALLDNWDTFIEGAAEHGVGTGPTLTPLLWTQPWDGTVSLSLQALHPLGVEICRRVRLRGADDGRISAVGTGSRVARVAAKEAKGIVGDPWTPVDVNDPKAFTVTGEGFSYRRMVALLDASRYRQPLLARPTKRERRTPQTLLIQAAALARGQGKTEGFHQREIILSPDAATIFASDDTTFAQRAESWAKLAADVAGKALRPALIQLLQGKDDPDWKKPSNDAQVSPWISQFDASVDRVFFADLDASYVERLSDRRADATWATRLSVLAESVFAAAQEAAPRTETVHWLGMARARNLLQHALHKLLPRLDERPEEVEHVAQ